MESTLLRLHAMVELSLRSSEPNRGSDGGASGDGGGGDGGERGGWIR